MGALAIHERAHAGEKPYACSMCPRRFSQKGSVPPHERTHTGERLYACSMCPKWFTNKVALPGTSGPTRARGRTLARCAHGGSATRATFPRTGGPTRARSHTLARCAQSGSHRRAKLCRTSGPTPQTKPSTAASQPAVRPIEFCSKLTNSMPPSTTAAPTPCSLTPGDARCAIRSRNLITLTIESHKKSGQYI